MSTTAIERLDWDAAEFEPGDPGLVALVAAGLEKAKTAKSIGKEVLNNVLGLGELVRPANWRPEPDKKSGY
jgi:hypothetical protein